MNYSLLANYFGIPDCLKIIFMEVDCFQDILSILLEGNPLPYKWESGQEPLTLTLYNKNTLVEFLERFDIVRIPGFEIQENVIYFCQLQSENLENWDSGVEIVRVS